MANSSGIHHQDGKNVSSSSNGADPIGGNSVLESSRTALKHNPGISTNWSLDEQAILDAALLKRRPSDSAITFYAKIATELPNKTVRDVALRCRWMTVEKKENSKRRKDENLARKGKDKKERVSDPKTSQFTASPFVPPYATPMMSTDSDEGIPSKAISGVARELLEQNGKVMKQISANLSIMQLHENLVLLAETRDNILKLMNDIHLNRDVPQYRHQTSVLNKIDSF
ncbi:hypothetical protein K2173_017207 [Erythroxylum novogranatense]|uniref:Myb-like domain-containing protein n=1 Tax=Erythroxylum novogranatense TaxID=1862640 RepID=A0AAV8U607_9ROSI|nr:hypothetical protein K2173_017207 [Erythroxylum novogranatense]